MKKKKLISILLVVAMMFSIMPTAVFAEVETPTHTNHCICGATHANVGDHTTEQAITWTAWESDNSLPPRSGTYYLSKNVTLSDEWEPSGDVTLCLNGHSIQQSGNNDRVIKVSRNNSLTITDCKSIGTITGGTTGNAAGGVLVQRGGSFTMYGGNISQNTSSYGGGGGGVYTLGIFTMYGGTISNNTASNGSGGGVRGDFTMHGGTISNNTAFSDGGGVSGIVTMTGGCIENNTAKNGSSVSGSLNISGLPKISGDVYLGSSGKITITGALALPEGYKNIPVYSAKDAQHVVITTGASEYGVITDGAQSIFVAQDTENTRIHVHDGEVCQESKPTVKFDAKGGSPTPATQTLPFGGDKATVPTENPTKNGFVFSHWCDDESCTDYTTSSSWNFNTVITESMILYAIWEPITVTITSEPGKFVAVTSHPAIAYQWCSVETNVTTVTYDFLVGQDIAFEYMYGENFDSETNKWTPKDYGSTGAYGYLYIALDAGETFTAEFDSALPAGYIVLLDGWNSTPYTIQATQQNGNIYTFTATEAGIYVLVVAEGDEEPVALSEVDIPNVFCKTNDFIYTSIEGQTAAYLITDNLDNGTYICKVTWNYRGTDDTSDDYTLISQPVEYTAPTTDSGDDEDNSSGSNEDVNGGTTPQPDYGYSGGYYVPVEQPKDEPKEPSKMDAVTDCHGDASCPISGYTDIDNDAWYHDGVHYCIENGIMGGYGNGIFRPNVAVSRAQISAMLWNMEGNPVVNYALDYKDVPADAWYTEAVRWMVSQNIAGGYGKGIYAPDDTLTREQLAAILQKYAQYKGYDMAANKEVDLQSYSDAASISDWAYTSMQWICDSGIVGGMPGTNGDIILAPTGHATRAQVATMLMTFCEMEKE